MHLSNFRVMYKQLLVKKFIGSTLAFITLPFASLTLLNKPASADTVACNGNEAAVFENRIHIRCNQSYYNGIVFFAAPLNSPTAQSYLQLITNAVQNNRGLTVYFDPNDFSGDSFGCNSYNCRPIRALYFNR